MRRVLFQLLMLLLTAPWLLAADAGAQFEVANKLYEQGRYPEAAAAYEQALLRTPNRTPSVQGLALANTKRGDLRSAR